MEDDEIGPSPFTNISAMLNRLETKIRDLEMRLAHMEREVKMLPHQHRIGTLGQISGTLADGSEQ
jgi:hypothetical protein